MLLSLCMHHDLEILELVKFDLLIYEEKYRYKLLTWRTAGQKLCLQLLLLMNFLTSCVYKMHNTKFSLFFYVAVVNSLQCSVCCFN